MPYAAYKLLHVVGLILLFLGLGRTLLGSRTDAENAGKGPAIFHGIALFVMLVGGFGMMARLGIHWPWPNWLIAKLGVWLAIGALPGLVRHERIPRGPAWLVAALLGALAGWLAIYKPF